MKAASNNGMHPTPISVPLMHVEMGARVMPGVRLRREEEEEAW
ncbi:MAG TPA: hypothetical protein VM095_00730 [Pyrinomonadaceae bacterium]|nr:hypothetical protein [Pyrinomonadaceae bacterium]